MKIIHIIPTLNKGGAEKLVLDICNELSFRPYLKVLLIVLSDKNTFKLNEYKFDIKFINIKFQYKILKPNVSKEINHLELCINEFSPDIIHSHLFESEFIPRLNNIDGVKYFSHIHSNTPQLTKPTLKNLFSKKGLIDYFVYREIVKLYKKVNNSFISISSYTDNFYKKNIPQFKNRIHLLPNAIRTSIYSSEKRDKGDKIKIISVGSLISVKNQNLQLQISKNLLEAGVKFELNIVGEGEDRDYLSKKILELNLQNNVNLIGHSNEVPKLLSQNNIFLHTAPYEAFGLVLIEAMANRLPIIALNGLGNIDIIQDGINGFIINQQEPNLFLEKILKIWNDQTEYKKMTDNAYQRSKFYDIVPYIDNLIKIYET